MQIQTEADSGSVELIDDIERLLFKAREAQRPFTEYLLYMAFIEELGHSGTSSKVRPRKGIG